MALKKLTGLLIFAAAVVVAARESSIFPLLRSTVALGKQDAGFYLLPTNQLLRPWGEQALIKGRPVDLAFDSRKRTIAVLNTRSVMLFDATSGAQLADIRTKATSYTGIAFRPGDRELWASETSGGGPDSIFIQRLNENGSPGEIERIDLPGHPQPCGIAFSADGNFVYIAMSRLGQVDVFDASRRTIVRSIDTGNVPFGVAFAVKRDRVFVTNRGGRRSDGHETTAPSSGTAVITDPVTGTTTSGSVTVIELKSGKTREVSVGLAPSLMALNSDESLLAVANGHSDSVSVLNTSDLTRTDVKIPAYPEGTLGSQPIALVFSPEGDRLYVACAGNNAVAVLTRAGKTWKVAGAVPAGWFPTALAIDSAGVLRVLNIKGVGNTADGKGGFNSRQYEGSLLKIPAPLPAQIAAGTREVMAANSPKYESGGGISNLSSLGIKHVFFIVKENRTYDQVFGDMAKGNSDPKLVMYGRDVTPNHHALAEKYVLLDNFDCGGAISFDGHQWLMQAFVSDYVERAFAASPRGYAWNMADALTVSPAGFFWQAGNKPLSVRIYGEFSLPIIWDAVTQNPVDITEKQELSWSDYWKLYKSGKWRESVGSRSGVPALQKYIDPHYPSDSTSIPDQMRADEFLRELAGFEKTDNLPNLSVITLNSDHTNGKRPGSPTPRAMVADDDLALGRMVEGVSKSRFWASSLILVVEDDAQDGVDHVDGHRTVALAIGPHIRRAAVDSNNYNHESMVRTIQEIFEIPQKTRFLAAARAMHSVFTSDADVSGYQHLTP
ncbi:MAG TPA: bifunctional YncE family protein/alkaline phosphatase family protein, partial [Bryobacteraceae bacterium]|nr:bifunctional YncE family protein/alkaline phosphatase family protein [Bryobacteraceae bacterium]